MQLRLLYFLLFAVLFCTLICNKAFATQPEAIYENQTKYLYDYQFASIDSITYFCKVGYDQSSMLWQTDGTKSGTNPVVALNDSSKQINIVSPTCLYAKNNKLVFISRIENKSYISIYNPLNKRYSLIDSIQLEFKNNYNLYKNFISLSTNLVMIGDTTNKIFFIDIFTDQVTEYQLPINKEYILKADSNIIIFRNKDSKLTLLSSKTKSTIWEMDSAGMSNFTYYSMSNGLILNNKDTTKKSLLINYSEIRVDTIRTFFIPKNFRIVDFEHKIFEVVDSGLVTLFRTNEYSQIIDTINTPDYESTVIGNKLYYYKTLIDKNSTNPYRTYKMWDLYSYDLESYQRALLVPNCLRPTGNSALLQHTFKNGKLVFFLTTQEYGSELYVTDGTQQGSSLLKDINQGPASAVLAPLGVNPEADFFCFNAISDKYGRTIWKTDGTELNTVPIFSFELPTVVPEIDSYDQIFVNKGYILFENKNIVYSLMSPKINPIVISNNYKIFDNIFSRDMGYSSSCWIFPSNILKDKSGNIYVSGNSRNYSSYYGLVYMKDKSYDTLLRENGSLGFVIKYNSSGQKLFTKYFTDDMDNEDIYSAIDSTGNIICFFSHNEHQPSYNNYSGLIKMTATGDTLWIKKFSHELNTNELDIQCDSNDNIYLLNNGENSKNISITKISPEGKNLIYKEFKQSVNINRINSSIISNRLYIGLSEHDEKLAIQNSKSASLNKIIASDLSLSILNEIQLNGEGWSTLSSINKGLGEDIIVSGSFRGTIDLSGNILSSAVTKDSNMTTSYLSHFDSELNLKYVKNLYPDPYLINSTCIFENKSIYTVGIYYNCNIDSTIYPNLYRYPKYNKFSVATKQYDYWGNELASFYYSKYFENYRHWLDPKVIEFNNKPLVYDVYQGKIGYIPDAYYSPYEDKILLLQPELYPTQRENSDQTANKYYIYSDNWGNNYIKAKFDTDANIKLTVKVIDITGKHILSFPLNLIDGTQQLSIPYYLTHGCYLLVIQDGTHTEHHKFMR